MKTDTQLQHDVLEELKWEPGIDHADIGVAVIDGVVSLSGIVKSYAEKLLAEQAAQRVSGVRALAEALIVRYPGQRKSSDAEIAKRVRDIIAWDPLVPDDRIAVKVEGGRVTLSGKVEWRYQADRASRAAGRITGVTGVTNLVVVDPKIDPVDVRQRIEDALKRHAMLDASRIDVMVEGHKVRLGGKVGSWQERDLIERAAWSAPGVTQIEDAITVA
jgi:osmotically-inducible protein OsmY